MKQRYEITKIGVLYKKYEFYDEINFYKYLLRENIFFPN